MVVRPSSAQQYVLKPEIRNPHNSPMREFTLQHMTINIRQFFPPSNDSPSRDSSASTLTCDSADDRSMLNESVSEHMEIED